MEGEQPVEGERREVAVELEDGCARVRLPDLDYRSLLRPRRRGEVAMVVERTPGWVLLQTKAHYPPGIFRLPTGTVQPREKPEAAMLRELHEEANLVPGDYRRLCRVEYAIEGGRKDFFTEVYLIEAPRGQLRPNDATEEINAWREAMLGELPAVAAELRRLDPPWHGWGIFRAVLHELVPRLLESRIEPTRAERRLAEVPTPAVLAVAADNPPTEITPAGSRKRRSR
jgi:ADP-ribose pyrophosphatase YjhB (NUDIX family)